jgi:glycosyltransferase involved in cell wall biosynthesis
METTPPTGRLISIVIPVYNEVEGLSQLAAELRQVAESNGLTFEIILVDDGSNDGSWPRIQELSSTDGCVRGLRLGRHIGKSAALAAGFQAARGEIVFQMDADLQDVPSGIPDFLKKLEEGYDLVNGWKLHRHDPRSKIWSSRVFNRVTSWLTGVHLHDHNCGMKCYRAEIVKWLHLHGGMHRFIPALAHHLGYRVGELAVQHRARPYGHSKYGFKRLFPATLDLIALTVLVRLGQDSFRVSKWFGAFVLFLGMPDLLLAACTSEWLPFGLMETIVGTTLVGLGFLDRRVG